MRRRVLRRSGGRRPRRGGCEGRRAEVRPRRGWRGLRWCGHVGQRWRWNRRRLDWRRRGCHRGRGLAGGRKLWRRRQLLRLDRRRQNLGWPVGRKRRWRRQAERHWRRLNRWCLFRLGRRLGRGRLRRLGDFEGDLDGLLARRRRPVHRHPPQRQDHQRMQQHGQRKCRRRHAVGAGGEGADGGNGEILSIGSGRKHEPKSLVVWPVAYRSRRGETTVRSCSNFDCFQRNSEPDVSAFELFVAGLSPARKSRVLSGGACSRRMAMLSGKSSCGTKSTTLDRDS